VGPGLPDPLLCWAASRAEKHPHDVSAFGDSCRCGGGDRILGRVTEHDGCRDQRAYYWVFTAAARASNVPGKYETF
jgi:hypothetical protein